ncbi:hypothetical protein CRUP_012753 [Coryphaenoides rupestris]|nr:hypothetical protein CRUP_012753 [Coryphaenoides rupestris]
MNLRRRFNETQSVRDRARPGSERVTTEADDRYIVMQHLRDRFQMAAQTAAETPGRRQPHISTSTVRRRLHSANLAARRPKTGPVLTNERRQKSCGMGSGHLPWTQHAGVESSSL